MAAHTKSIDFLWKIAEWEARNGNASQIKPTHFFLAFLKLVDLSIDQINKSNRHSLQTLIDLCREASDIRVLFYASGVPTTEVRRQLRGAIFLQKNSSEKELHRSAMARRVFAIAESFAEKSPLRLVHLLSVLCEVRMPEVEKTLGAYPGAVSKLRELSTNLAIDQIQQLTEPAGKPLGKRWVNLCQKFCEKGWQVQRERDFKEGRIYWTVSISKETHCHKLRTDDFSTLLIEMSAILSGMG